MFWLIARMTLITAKQTVETIFVGALSAGTLKAKTWRALWTPAELLRCKRASVKNWEPPKDRSSVERDDMSSRHGNRLCCWRTRDDLRQRWRKKDICAISRSHKSSLMVMRKKVLSYPPLLNTSTTQRPDLQWGGGSDSPPPTRRLLLPYFLAGIYWCCRGRAQGFN